MAKNLLNKYVWLVDTIYKAKLISYDDINLRLLDNDIIGRQYMIPIGSRQFKVDLVFYHTILKCYVLIDLKRAEIKHGDIGQMNLYLNYFKNEICQPDDNPPVGIVLGARKDELLMEYALQGIDNQLFAARYQLYLPNREELQSQLDNLLNNSF